MSFTKFVSLTNVINDQINWRCFREGFIEEADMLGDFLKYRINSYMNIG